jgi:hypothetical protein
MDQAGVNAIIASDLGEETRHYRPQFLTPLNGDAGRRFPGISMPGRQFPDGNILRSPPVYIKVRS